MEVTIVSTADSFFSSNIDPKKKKKREREKKKQPLHLKNKCGRTNKQVKEMRISLLHIHARTSSHSALRSS